MIERFNFYDLYGYLIPGIVLLLSIGAPSVVIYRRGFEANEWLVLIAGVVVAYILGHIIQGFANSAIPSSRDKERRSWKYYSATMLDPNDKTFDLTTKTRIAENVRGWFDLNVDVTKPSDEHIGAVRQDAFYLARKVAKKDGAYSEQFEGLYVMMRGISVALWFGASFALGGVLSAPIAHFCAYIGLAITVLALPVLAVVLKRKDLANRRDLNAIAIGGICVALLSAGMLAAPGAIGLTQRGELLLCVLAFFFISQRTLGAYYYFAWHFARAVWLQFAAEPSARP